jgi:hypothetical protein
MSGTAYNPWTLQDYFKTIAYTLVYSSNFGFDEFFLLSTFFTYLKVYEYFKAKNGEASMFDFIKIFWSRFLRLAPVFYAVFLLGWLVGPYLNNGPWWYTYQMGFCNCQNYWWSVFTMTINFFPDYQVANEGCYYWGWFVACEMQLFLFVPLLVYLLEYKAGQFINYISVCSIVGLGTYINYKVIFDNNMSAGLFAPQDILIFKLWLNKPYTKLHSVGMGILMAQLYLKVGKVDTGKLKPWLYFLAIGTLGFLSIYPKSANHDPSSWSREKSALFVSLSRPAFLFCLVLIW